jgi:hypothetical protein
LSIAAGADQCQIRAMNHRLPTVLLLGLLLAGCAPRPEYTATPAAPVATQPAAAASASPRPQPDELLQRAAAAPMEPFPGEDWNLLFNGKDLGVWHVSDFAGGGEVKVESGLLVLGMGGPFTGVGCSNPPARMNYELALDAMRVSGSDFFCGLTLPVGSNCCSLIVGGWGGGVVGISSLDGYDASENETTKFLDFERGRWYRLRMRVTEKKLEAWLDDRKVVNVATEERRIAVRPGEIETSQPLGIACYSTTAAIRGLRWRAVSGPASEK